MMAKRGTDAVMLTSGASGRINALFSLRALRSLWLLINAFFLILLLPFRGRRRCAAAPEASEKGIGGKEEKAVTVVQGKVVRVPAAMVPRRSAVDKEVAARRALAVKRVVEDKGDGENKNTAREFALFVTSRGDTIFTQSWTPVKVQIRGVVVILHGLNEHSGRYSDFAKKLNANGVKVYGMDWIGTLKTFFIFSIFCYFEK
ncbi:Triacylglycerol lipase [Handroanthus impetiginosus]|uniref:Triacylglycerol lipase n=1 Tax=Handroanthus impetiginosus TaxID=429701 RepID=A0A2G9HN64_9LAMI|nr:Triacylglycerol lipase [Handroanthus impetiginosus]